MASTPIEPDGDSSSSSGFESGFESDTTSLKSSILNYEYENGRRYPSRSLTDKYALPNDETEQDRLDIAHHIFTMLLEGKTHVAPLENPHRVLDLGTGTGVWALEFAEQFPSAQVIGVDLSPIQPTWVLPNVQFQIDDIEKEWTWQPDSFDYIHIRTLLPTIKDWPELFKQCYRCVFLTYSSATPLAEGILTCQVIPSALKPGGYLEVVEWCKSGDECDDDTTNGTAMQHYYKLLDESSRKAGGCMTMDTPLSEMLPNAGFINYQEIVLKLPVGPWPRNKKLKELGAYVQLMMESGFEAYSLALFTHSLRMDPTEVQKLIKDCKAELRTRKVHAYGRTWFAVGQKPMDE